MTAEEQQMLEGLAERIRRTPVQDKDADAEQFIERTLGAIPDSAYVMAQTILVQQYALNQAQAQIGDLKAQLSEAAQPARHTGSFLGNLLGGHGLGGHDTAGHDTSGRQVAPPPPPVWTGPSGAGQYGQGPLYAPSGGYPIAGAAQPGGGFLRSAMQTAAGVAAGALAFEGIESLMHGFGHAAGYGSEFGGAGFGAAGLGGGPREEIVNNYYGGAAPHEHSGGIDRADDASQLKAADDRGDGSQLHNASYETEDTGAKTDADDLDGTAGSDYSADQDDSMLSDSVGDDGGDSSSF